MPSLCGRWISVLLGEACSSFLPLQAAILLKEGAKKTSKEELQVSLSFHSFLGTVFGQPSCTASSFRLALLARFTQSL